MARVDDALLQRMTAAIVEAADPERVILFGSRARGDATVNGMEGFWSLFKRGYHGTFHKLSAKHLDRYVQEFTGRNNIRDMDTLDQMAALARRFAGRRLTYRALIADNGLSSGARPAA